MDDRLKGKWLRFLNNEAEEEEIAEVLNYIRNDGSELDVHELDDLWKQLDAYPKLQQEHANLIYREIVKQTRTTRPRGQQFSLSWSLKVAASVIFILGIGLCAYLVSNHSAVSYEEISTDHARKTVVLADGSEIILNHNTRIRYPEQFGESKREVYLEGEAFFNVENDPDRPFIVHSGAIETQVLGTSFDIAAHEDEDYEIAVVTGKVKVSGHVGQRLQNLAVLTPGKRLSYGNKTGTVNITEISPDKIAQWKQTKIFFENEALDEVLKVLGRRYGVKFTFESERVKNCRLSMTIEKESLQTVMEDLRMISNQAIEYHITGRTVVVGGKGCDPLDNN